MVSGSVVKETVCRLTVAMNVEKLVFRTIMLKGETGRLRWTDGGI